MNLSNISGMIFKYFIGIFLLSTLNISLAVKNSIDNLYFFGGSFTSNGTNDSRNMWPGFLASKYSKSATWKTYNYAHGGGSSDDLAPQRSTGVIRLGANNYTSYFQNIDSGVVPKANSKDIAFTYTGPNDFAANEYLIAINNDHLDAIATANGFPNGPAYLAVFGLFLDPAIVANSPGNISLDNIGPNVSNFLDRRLGLIKNHITSLKEGKGLINQVVLNHFYETDRSAAGVLDGVVSGNRDSSGERIINKHIAEWNKRLVVEMKSTNSNVVLIDYNKLVSEVVSSQHNPADPNSDLAKSYIPNDAENHGATGLYNPSNPNNFGAFFPSHLGSHPGPAAQEITANYVASVLEATYFVPEVTNMAIDSGRNYVDQVFSHRQKRIDKGRTFSVAILGSKTLDTDVPAKDDSIGYEHKPSFNGAVKFDYNINNMFGVGFAAGYYSQKMDMDAVKITSKHKEYLFSVLPEVRVATPMNSSVIIQGLFGLGRSTYNVDREIPMVLQTRTEKGETKNTRFVSGIRAAMLIRVHKMIAVKPYVEGIYQTTGKISYTEDPQKDGDGKELTRSTRMKFNAKSRNAFDLSGGVTAIGNISVGGGVAIMPYVEINAKYGFLNNIGVADRKAQVSDIDNEFHAFDTYSINLPSKLMGGIKLGVTVQKGVVSTSINYEIFKPRTNKLSHQVFFDVTAIFA